MSGKPSYLGLLNAIAVAEQRGFEVLDAWGRATGDAELAGALQRVAIREREHGAAFTKRLCELGYGTRQSSSPEFDASLACARSTAPDAEKFRHVLGYGGPRDQQPDPLARVFDDRTIDPQTGALLGRFVAEERDSERLLRAAWGRCGSATAARTPAPDDEDSVLTDLVARIDRLAQTLEDLKQLRR
jgi:hypothetical protein